MDGASAGKGDVVGMAKRIKLNILALVGIYTFINIAWRILEIIEFGQVQPSISDTIIGALLTISLFEHLRLEE